MVVVRDWRREVRDVSRRSRGRRRAWSMISDAVGEQLWII